MFRRTSIVTLLFVLVVGLPATTLGQATTSTPVPPTAESTGTDPTGTPEAATAPEPCFVSTATERTATVRVGPGTNRTALLFLKSATPYSVIGLNVLEDESVWFKLLKEEVDPGSGAAELWVSTEGVEWQGDCLAVPAAAAPPIVPILNSAATANAQIAAANGQISVNQNADWTPVEADFDGVPMMLVPAGCFNMGSDNGYDWEKPVHQICFDVPFWIDKTEVTEGQFRNHGGNKAFVARLNGDEGPTTAITWFEADAYCQQRGARLPTEAEWEYAARGPESWEYPWGDTFVGDNLVYEGSKGGPAANVGNRPAGASWVGAQDMSGNVVEWTSSLFSAYPYDASDGREADTGSRTDVTRVLRSSAWFYGSDSHRAASRGGTAPSDWDGSVGFRCARSS